MIGIRNIVILTGAGISAESGIATFRGPGGLWEGHRVEDVCTPEALAALRRLVARRLAAAEKEKPKDPNVRGAPRVIFSSSRSAFK